MLPQPLFFDDAQPQQAAQKLQIFLTAKHYLDQGQVVRIERKDIFISRNPSEPHFPAPGQGFDKCRPKDIRVVTESLHE